MSGDPLDRIEALWAQEYGPEEIDPAPGADPVYEPRCAKCGSDDVLVRWHPARPTNRRASCRDSMSVLDYGRLPESHKEHLHCHCRRCQFQWLDATVGDSGGAS